MRLAKHLGLLVVGGVSFWAPRVMTEVITRREISPLVGTVAPIASVLLVYWLISRPRAMRTRWGSVWMLVGLYLFGPLMITVGGSYLGGPGFESSELGNFVIASLVPLFTLYMSGPSVLGVALATLALISIHVGIEARA